MENKDVFNTLNAININGKVEKKNGLNYLSWAWAWGELKKKYPDATYTVYENKKGWNYFTDGITGWVKTGVTVNGIEHIEYLPIMDFRNKSIPAANITSFDVNKAIQRSVTKAIGRHGLGLYIYAGEDLPEEEVSKKTEEETMDIVLKIETYNDLLTDEQKQKISKAKDEKNIAYLSSILSWCQKQPQKKGA